MANWWCGSVTGWRSSGYSSASPDAGRLPPSHRGSGWRTSRPSRRRPERLAVRAASGDAEGVVRGPRAGSAVHVGAGLAGVDGGRGGGVVLQAAEEWTRQTQAWSRPVGAAPVAWSAPSPRAGRPRPRRTDQARQVDINNIHGSVGGFEVQAVPTPLVVWTRARRSPARPARHLRTSRVRGSSKRSRAGEPLQEGEHDGPPQGPPEA